MTRAKPGRPLGTHSTMGPFTLWATPRNLTSPLAPPSTCEFPPPSSLLFGSDAPEICVLCCAVLCCAVLCCAVLCCAVLCCAVLCCAVLCCAVLCCAVLCCAVLCCAVLCCAVLCCAVLCCAVLPLNISEHALELTACVSVHKCVQYVQEARKQVLMHE